MIPVSGRSAIRTPSSLRAEAGARDCCLLPHTPILASPFRLRFASDRFLSTEPNTSCTIEMPASLRSDGVQVRPGTPFGFPPESAFSIPGIPKQPLTEQEAFQFGVDAYVYGYPLLVMDSVRRVSTNVVSPQGKLATIGQFANYRSFPDPSKREVAGADSLYSMAWLDTSWSPTPSTGQPSWVLACSRQHIGAGQSAWTTIGFQTKTPFPGPYPAWSETRHAALGPDRGR
jgi:hypothetical protein